ncbi:hypothetical protein P9112_004126 [Eukaryota sp. TZLM1-RC]
MNIHLHVPASIGQTDLKCRCRHFATLHHIFNCNKFGKFRDFLHNRVREKNQSFQEIPNRSLFNLQFCCKKLQQKLSKIFESLNFDVRLGLAKKKNPDLANLLQDMCDSTSSASVTTIPQVNGTLLTDSAWTLNKRFRSFIWPDNLPHNFICRCS